jgi:hypothetical protein
MSLIENYGEPRLFSGEFPDHHDPHRCGTSPFVPVADAPRQHSCGSYASSFGPDGCSTKYRPNYPDDLYIKTHGCKGLADCYRGVPPSGHVGYEGTRITSGSGTERANEWHRAWGYTSPSNVGPGPHGCAVLPPAGGDVASAGGDVAAVKEGFGGGGGGVLPGLHTCGGLLFWVILACLAYKFLVKKK